MDYLGILRRVAGIAGVVVVTFGLASQTDTDTAINTLTTVLGGLVALADFGWSVFKKSPLAAK